MAMPRLLVRLRLDGLPVSTAPPASTTSEAALRPSSGSASTCSFVMIAPTDGLRVSTSGADASTDTVSSRLPSCSVTGITGLLLTCSTMPVCANVRNPESVASRRYGPMGRFSSANEPFVVGDDFTPEAGVGLDGDDGDTRQDGAARVRDCPVDLRRSLGPRIGGGQQKNQAAEQNSQHAIHSKPPR